VTPSVLLSEAGLRPTRQRVAILEAMERIVMHEGPHRPILSNDLARQADHTPKFHASGFNVDCTV